MPVVAEFTFDAARHYRATRAVQRRSWMRWAPMVVLVLVGASLGLSMWTANARGDSATRTFFASLPYLFGIGAFFACLRLLTRWSFSRLPKHNPSLLGVQRQTLDEEGFHFVGNGVRLDVPWNVLHHVRETPEFLLIYYNKRMAYYLPLRELSPSQVVDARAIISTHMDATKVEYAQRAG
jgi:hypothetical protein